MLGAKSNNADKLLQLSEIKDGKEILYYLPTRVELLGMVPNV